MILMSLFLGGNASSVENKSCSLWVHVCLDYDRVWRWISCVTGLSSWHAVAGLSHQHSWCIPEACSVEGDGDLQKMVSVGFVLFSL